jgi:hypothetical protein
MPQPRKIGLRYTAGDSPKPREIVLALFQFLSQDPAKSPGKAFEGRKHPHMNNCWVAEESGHVRNS